MTKTQSISVSICVIIALGLLVYLVVGYDGTHGLDVGDKAEDFTLKDIHGIDHTLSEILKQKPVVLIFGSFT